MSFEPSQLDSSISKLIRDYGAINILNSIITHCDASADFAHQTNDKKLEAYWRSITVALFDTIKKIPELPKHK